MPYRLLWAEEFKLQLSHFKDIKDRKTGKHKAFAADDDEVHDDIVFTYLMGAWWFTRGGEAVSTGGDRELSGGSGQQNADWNPIDFF